MRPVLFFFIIASLVLAACGVAPSNQNWPGLSAEGETIYVAYGAAVAAYDAQTQAQQWSFPTTARANLFFFAPPFVEDGRLYFGDYGAAGGFFSPNVTVSIYGLDTADSAGAPRELWVNSTAAKDKIIGQPLVVDGRLFVGTSDNYILALDAEDGVELWRVETGHSIWDQPAYRDDVLYVTSIDRTVYALNAQTGAEIWRTRLDGALPSRPVLNHDMLYVGSFDRQVHALDLATGAEVWTADAEDWVWGAPAVADANVYYADLKGNVFAVDAATGDPIWRAQTVGAVQTSPLVVGDLVYVVSGEGAGSETARGALTAFGAADGVQRWQALTPGPLFATPVVVDDTIVVALQSEAALLIGFDLETGAQRWLVTPP